MCCKRIKRENYIKSDISLVCVCVWSQVKLEFTFSMIHITTDNNITVSPFQKKIDFGLLPKSN